MDEATIRRRLRSIGWKQHLLPTQDAERYFVDIEKPVVLQGATAVSGDFHIPLFDPDYLNQAIEHWREAKLKQLVIGGDFWNEDGLSSFEYKQKAAGLSYERAEGQHVLAKLLETFKHIVFIRGNHDARFLKAIGYAVPFPEAMRMMFADLDQKLMDRVTVSGLDYCLVEAGGETYRIAHPKDYSSVPNNNGRRLAAKYQQHVLCLHSHHTAIAPDASGQFITAEVGGFFDISKTEYVQRTTAHARWTKGYGFIEADGHFVLESELWGTRR